MKAASQCMGRSRPPAAAGGEDRERSRSPTRPPAPGAPAAHAKGEAGKRRQREKDEEEEEVQGEEEGEEEHGRPNQGGLELQPQPQARSDGQWQWELLPSQNYSLLSSPPYNSSFIVDNPTFHSWVRVQRWDDRFYQFHIEVEVGQRTQRTAATVHLTFNPSAQHRQ